MKNLKLNFKISIAIICAIVVIGTLLGLLIGGFGTDFTGGTGLKVVYSDSIAEAEYEKLHDDLSDMLNKLGFKSVSSSKLVLAENIYGLEFSFPSKIGGKSIDNATFKALQVLVVKGDGELSDAQKQTLTQKLGSNFNFASIKTVTSIANSVITERNAEIDLETSPFFVKEANFYLFSVSGASVNTLLWCGLCAGVGLLAAAIYCGIRFFQFGFENNKFLNGIRCALSVIINSVISLIFTVALSIVFAVIFSAHLQTSFAVALLIAVFYSIITTAYTLNQMRSLDKEGEDVAAVTSKTVPVVGILTAIVLLATITLALVGTIFTGAFACAVAAGVIAAAFCSLFILPPVWGALKFKRSTTRTKQKVTQETK